MPGLPSDQYFFTLAFSITGGLIAGFVSRIKPQGAPADKAAQTAAHEAGLQGLSRLQSNTPGLEPTPPGVVQRQWVWLLVFSPLWAPLFINFGLGPVVSRTSDIAPVLGNTAGFLAAAALPYLDKLGQPAQQPGDGGSGSA